MYSPGSATAQRVHVTFRLPGWRAGRSPLTSWTKSACLATQPVTDHNAYALYPLSVKRVASIAAKAKTLVVEERREWTYEARWLRMGVIHSRNLRTVHSCPLKASPSLSVATKNQALKWEAVQRTTRKGTIDAVEIIALVRGASLPGPHLCIEIGYRPATGGFCLEFPAGLVDGNESPEQAALRELREETGWIGQSAVASPTTFFFNAALVDEVGCAVVIQVDADKQGPERTAALEDDEFIFPILVPLHGLRQRLDRYSSFLPLLNVLTSWAIGIRRSTDCASTLVCIHFRLVSSMAPCRRAKNIILFTVL